MNPIHVTCAIISFGDTILVVQRSEKMNLPLKWEFPGGKVETGETEENCILREIREELNIEIELDLRLEASQYDYPNVSIMLIPFTAKYIYGEIKLSEHKEYRLLPKAQLRDLDWAPADLPVLDRFLEMHPYE
jgi:8-oxo-dGTP diphosphatase